MIYFGIPILFSRTLRFHLFFIELFLDELQKRNKEIKVMKDKEKESVARSRFEGVCSELNSALEREKKAQRLLREQNVKLQVRWLLHPTQSLNEFPRTGPALEVFWLTTPRPTPPDRSAPGSIWSPFTCA